jgi:hypothetical protein
MTRRAWLRFGATAAAFVLAGHRPVQLIDTGRRGQPAGPQLVDLNPDRMWPVYRRYHLLIVGQRDDAKNTALAAATADTLVRFLPASRAQVTSAPDARRVGVLIATVQQDVAIMAKEGAEALFLGKPPFADIGGAQIRAMVSFDNYLFVCRPDFKARHAYLIAQALAQHPEGLPARAGAPEGAVPAHPGAEAFFADRDMPND